MTSSPTFKQWFRAPSNLSKWDYSSIDKIALYGDSTTYKLGADFLKGLNTVEDWGCGKGGFRSFCLANNYIGIDGSPSQFADHVVDLAVYKSSVDGIFMRHVLEHDWRWRQLLKNALSSFTKKMCLVIFTPFTEMTHAIATNKSIGNVPDLSFNKQDLTDCFKDLNWSLKQAIKSDTQYGFEHVFFITKDNSNASSR
ncbi:MAG: hypothetical protein Q8R76_06245 [Candidatus Omnitrophota bacterium]|nr:hypothetical protein [Candidatus Omnitrophota bacterium]